MGSGRPELISMSRTAHQQWVAIWTGRMIRSQVISGTASKFPAFHVGGVIFNPLNSKPNELGLGRNCFRIDGCCNPAAKRGLRFPVR